MNRAVIVMAKRPRAGHSKTRLIPTLGADNAAGLSMCMIHDTVAFLERRNDCTPFIAVDPPESQPWFEAEFPGVRLLPQRGSSLGERLAAALAEVLHMGFDSVFAIGSDSPDLPPSHLDEAFALLEDPETDVVLGPTEDGGYYAIGWKRPWPDITVGVEMSTPSVLKESMRIATERGAATALAPRWYDVDEAEHLSRLQTALANRLDTESGRFLADHLQTDTDRSKIVVVIPALDEEGNIAGVVASLADHGFTSVVVVDNGSADRTAEMAWRAGATVVSEARRGYGYASAAGSIAALKADANVIVYIDGDGSSRGSEVSLLVKPIIDGEADLVLGSRVKGTMETGSMPAHQRLGNRLTSTLMRALYSLDVTDLGPFRAIDASLLRSLDLREMTFGWPTEMMVKSAALGARIVEVPVSWDQRFTGQSKVGGTLRGSLSAGFDILRVTLRHARRRRSR